MVQVVNNYSTFLISFSGHNLIIQVGIKVSRKMQQLPFRKKNAAIIYYHPLHFILSTYDEKISSNRMNDILEMNCRLTQMCGTNSDVNFFGWVMMSPFLFEPEQVLP